MRYPKFMFRKFISKRKLAENYKLLMQKDCRYCTATDCIKGCSALLLQTKFELLELRGGRSDVLSDTLYSIVSPEYADADFNEQEEMLQSEQKNTVKSTVSVASQAQSVDPDPFDLKKLEEAVKQAKLKKAGDCKNE